MYKKLLYITFLLFLTIPGFTQLTAQIGIDRTDATYCLGDTVFFTNNSTGTYVTSYWDFGDGTDTWTENPIHVYQSTGTFTVQLIITDTAANKDTATITITVNPAPNLQLINDPVRQTLTARVDDPANTTFRWFFNGDSTNATDSIIYYFESGNYAVVATNQYGCSDSAAIDINLNTGTYTTTEDSLAIIVANNILTPNNDGINDVLFIKNLSTFPAPCQVLIYNQWGVLVYRNDNYTNLGGFDGRDNKGRWLPSGTYYYVIKSQGKKTATGFIDLIR